MTAAAAAAAASTTAGKRKLRDVLAEARLGAREAQYELGLMYANGVGVKQDLKEAVAWVGKAADKGLASAQYMLATQYAAGADDRAVHSLLSRAAEQGHLRAVYRLARMYESAQPQLAQRHMLKAAELGLPEAQCAVGRALARSAGEGAAVADMPSALRWLRKSAEQGWAAAQHELGVMHAEGRGVVADMSVAMQWLRKAAAQDHAPSVVALACLDAEGHGRSGDEANFASDRRRDPRRWSTVADPGDADSRYQLGLMFEHGYGVPARRSKAKAWHALAAGQGDARAQAALAGLLEASEPDVARRWYEQSAARGHHGAQAALGRLSSNHEGDPAEALRGIQWYSLAAKGGDPLALLTLGHLFAKPQEHVAHECFRLAAEQGVAQAQFLVGQLFESGVGAPANVQLAAQWYSRAAGQGHAEAQCALGVCYLNGNGVTRSSAFAFSWFQRAAEQGLARAQWNLGALHASGDPGVEQDLRRAFAWCQKAADQGFAPAKATLGLLHVRMDQPEQAFTLLGAAAAAGDGEAQYNLALLLSKGQGCVLDPRAAFSWFAKAAERGIPQAQSRLALLYATGDGVALDAIEAHKWFVIAARGGDAAARENRKHSESRLDTSQVDEAERRASGWRIYRQPLGDERLA